MKIIAMTMEVNIELVIKKVPPREKKEEHSNEVLMKSVRTMYTIEFVILRLRINRNCMMKKLEVMMKT